MSSASCDYVIQFPTNMNLAIDMTVVNYNTTEA